MCRKGGITPPRGGGARAEMGAIDAERGAIDAPLLGGRSVRSVHPHRCRERSIRKVGGTEEIEIGEENGRLSGRGLSTETSYLCNAMDCD